MGAQKPYCIAPMSAIYCCVAYKDQVLSHRGKNDKIENQFLNDIPSILKNFTDKDNMRTSQSHGNMMMYVLLHNQMTYLCFCDSGVSKQAAYGFLNDVQEAFSSRYGLAMVKNAVKLQMDREFNSVLQQKMSSIKQYASQSQDLLKDLDEVKGLVMRNVDEVMKRSNQLQDVENAAMDLRDNADLFVNSTDQLKKQMLKKKIAMVIGVIVAIVAVALCIILPIVL